MKEVDNMMEVDNMILSDLDFIQLFENSEIKTISRSIDKNYIKINR